MKVAIFEDNKHLRETLQILLDSSGRYSCSGAWSNCRNMIPLLEAHPAEIILMDIEMPGMNGIDATRLLKERFPGILVLIQTVFSEDEYIFNAICAGASGYILKTTSPAGYLQALDDVRAGGSPMTPGIARRVLELFRENAQPIAGTAVDYKLTAQEKKVLQLLVDGKSYKMIAAELFISLDTVKTHVSNVYAKLQVHSGTEAVAKAIRDKIV
ncbi:MAG TPA: response regulator transcription factor [Chitinophagaceae bacterium]|nr:response regulator transcription factor [Chitinophagaceae bacterium]